MAFVTYDVSLELVRALRPLVEVVATKDRDLASQIRRAASSIALNVSEGTERSGGDRPYHFRVAFGSAREVRAGVHLAVAWGYLPAGASTSALALLDRLGSLLWGLTRR
jgi:four helix bundle protein